MIGLFDQIHTDDFFPRLLQFFIGGLLDKKQSWMDYPSVIPQAGSRHDVLHKSIRDTVSYFAGVIPGMLPMADYIGRGVASALVGSPRNAYGVPSLFGFMPAGWGGGTASSAFQQSLRLSSLRYLLLQKDKVSLALRNNYIQDYYTVVYPKDTKQRDLAIKAAKSNPFSVPRALGFLLDPVQLRKQTQNILDVAANTLQYGIQRDPLNILNTRLANKAMSTARDIALQASKKPGEYGGFTPAAVTLMANALSKGSDMFLQFRTIGQTIDDNGLNAAAKTFTEKVQRFTQALQPLRDIFGNNVQHMADMITTLSGMPIGQMSSSQVLRYATNISNTIRATGLAPAALAPYVAGANAGMRRYQADSLTRLSALDIGTHLAVLGNRQGPSTMSRALYVGLITDAYTSGQASINSRRIAQAYAIAVNENKFTGSIQDFVLKIRTQPDPLQAAMRLANVSTADQLERGSGYRLMGIAITDKALGVLAVLQQYKQQIGDAVQGAFYRLGGVNQDVKTKLAAALSNPLGQNALLVSRLFSQSGLGFSDRDKKLVRETLNLSSDTDVDKAILMANTIRHERPDIGSRAEAVMQTRRHRVFLRAQELLKLVFKDVNGLPTGGIYSVISNYITSKEGAVALKDAKGNDLLPKDKADAVKRYLLLFGSQVFGTYDGADAQRRAAIHTSMRNLSTALGDSSDLAASVMIAGTSGAFAADAKYRESLRILGKGDTQSKLYKDAQDYIWASVLFGDTENGAKLFGHLTDMQKTNLQKDLKNKITKYMKDGQSALLARQNAYRLVGQEAIKASVDNATAKWIAKTQGVTKAAASTLSLIYQSNADISWSDLDKTKAGKAQLKRLQDAGVTETTYNQYLTYMGANAGNPLKKQSANLLTVLGSLNTTLGLLTKAIGEFIGLKTTGEDNKGGKGGKK